MLLLLLAHIRIIDYRLQITLYACRRCFQFVSHILRKLTLDAQLVFFAVLQLPIKRNDVVRDFSQFIIRNIHLKLCIQLVCTLSLCGEVAQMSDVLSQTVCISIKDKTEKYCYYYSEYKVLTVSFKTMF